MENRLLVIVPAFREEDNIIGVIREINEQIPGCDILVVNDCSPDHTFVRACSTGTARVINLPANLGVGGAVQTGFQFAVANGYDMAVQIDGDGQHIPSEIRKLLDKQQETGADMVIGSRFLDRETRKNSFRSTWIRRVGIGTFSFLYRILLRVRVKDATSGFRLYNQKSFTLLSRYYPDDYPEPESVVLLIKCGMKVAETPVCMRQRAHGTSSITPLKSVYYMLKVMLCILLASMRRRCPSGV